MTSESRVLAEVAFACAVERCYAALAAYAAAPENGEPALGGKLLFAGALDEASRALVVAGNVAGAATLAASADSVVPKQALHDGVIDFLVNSLDEALRILKNEVRKRETVAVCVALAPQRVEAEMKERGVAPDLLAGGNSAGRPAGEGSGFARKASVIHPIDVGNDEVLVIWNVAAAPLKWLPKLDLPALECVDREAWEARRWLRLAPRFLGRLARGVRVLRCEPNAAGDFVARVELAFLRREIGVPVEVEVLRRGMSERYRFAPEMTPRCTE